MMAVSALPGDVVVTPAAVMITSPYADPEFLDAVAELGKPHHKTTPDQFSRVANLIISSEASGGRVTRTGIGKSECVANYIATSLAGLAQIYVRAALSIELQARKNVTRDEFLMWPPAGKIG